MFYLRNSSYCEIRARCTHGCIIARINIDIGTLFLRDSRRWLTWDQPCRRALSRFGLISNSRRAIGRSSFQRSEIRAVRHKPQSGAPMERRHYAKSAAVGDYVKQHVKWKSCWQPAISARCVETKKKIGCFDKSRVPSIEVVLYIPRVQCCPPDKRHNDIAGPEAFAELFASFSVAARNFFIGAIIFGERAR